MIDTQNTQITAAIFAFTYKDSFFVKRLNNLPDVIEAHSDNAEYPTFTIERDQIKRLVILGRVIWVGHTL